MVAYRIVAMLLSALLVVGVRVGDCGADVGTPALMLLSEKVGNELDVALVVNADRELAALDIPIKFGHSGAPIELFEVQWSDEVGAWDFAHASIDNEQKTVIIGLICDLTGRSGHVTLAASPPGKGSTIAKLRFRVSDPNYRLIVEPITTSNPDHELTFVYNDLVEGKPTVRTIRPAFKFDGEAKSGDRLPLPWAFELTQNVPNPFNPSTTFALSLPVASDYRVRIYNVTGQLVRSYEGYLDAGIHTIVWNGKNDEGFDVASGVYFYSAEAGGFTYARRMVLLR